MKQPTIVLLPCCSYILVTVDFTVMPANAKLVMTSLNVLGTVLGMGASTIGHVQLPAYQGQIKEQTVMAHRRTIEDGLVKHGLSLEKDVVLLFDKSNCRQSDSRASVQKCIATFHKNFTPDFAACSAVSGNRVDTVPLLPVSEFYSYDDTAKPGPAERVETFLVTLSSAFCVSIEIFCLFFFLAFQQLSVLIASTFMNCIAKSLREGVKAHLGVLDAYMDGMDLKDGDRFIVFDLLPNRWGQKLRVTFPFKVSTG